jgi:hypothetical protein
MGGRVSTLQLQYTVLSALVMLSKMVAEACAQSSFTFTRLQSNQ